MTLRASLDLGLAAQGPGRFELMDGVSRPDAISLARGVKASCIRDARVRGAPAAKVPGARTRGLGTRGSVSVFRVHSVEIRTIAVCP